MPLPSLSRLMSDHPDASCIFDDWSIEVVDKPATPNADGSKWGTRKAVVTKDRDGKIISERFLLPGEAL